MVTDARSPTGKIWVTCDHPSGCRGRFIPRGAITQLEARTKAWIQGWRIRGQALVQGLELSQEDLCPKHRTIAEAEEYAAAELAREVG